MLLGNFVTFLVLFLYLVTVLIVGFKLSAPKSVSCVFKWFWNALEDSIFDRNSENIYIHYIRVVFFNQCYSFSKYSPPIYIPNVSFLSGHFCYFFIFRSPSSFFRLLFDCPFHNCDKKMIESVQVVNETEFTLQVKCR